MYSLRVVNLGRDDMRQFKALIYDGNKQQWVDIAGNDKHEAMANLTLRHGVFVCVWLAEINREQEHNERVK
jgi:hypothetical protein